MKTLNFADLQLSELSGTVETAVSWRGLSRGRYRRCFRSIARAATGSFEPNSEVVVADGIVEAFGRQTRRYSTREPAEADRTVLDDQHEQLDHIDVGFSFLVQWCGIAAIREFGVVMTAFTERVAGRPEADETDERVVRWDGSLSSREDLVAIPGVEVYDAQWTSNAEWNPSISATAVRQSLVSEAAALRMAQEAATAQIDYWRERVGAPILGGLVDE